MHPSDSMESLPHHNSSPREQEKLKNTYELVCIIAEQQRVQKETTYYTRKSEQWNILKKEAEEDDRNFRITRKRYKKTT